MQVGALHTLTVNFINPLFQKLRTEKKKKYINNCNNSNNTNNEQPQQSQHGTWQALSTTSTTTKTNLQIVLFCVGHVPFHGVHARRCCIVRALLFVTCRTHRVVPVSERFLLVSQEMVTHTCKSAQQHKINADKSAR